MGKFQKFSRKSDSKELKIAVRSSNGVAYVDYRNTDTLRRLMSPNGKILTRKRTSLSSYEQRMVANAIKRARYMGLLPYTSATL